MRYFILMVMFFISLPVSAQNVTAAQADTALQRILISDIRIEGFVLYDKNQFIKLFKPYRNTHLSAADMDTILQKIQRVYEQEGYQGLVSIGYHVIKKRLTYTVSLIK